MAKVTDLNEIKATAVAELNENGSELLEYLTLDEAADAMTMIYVTNDQMSGHGQDYLGNLSIVSSPQRIAIIFLGHHSYYKYDGNICGYFDIEEDMAVIRTCLDAALLRWQELFA